MRTVALNHHMKTRLSFAIATLISLFIAGGAIAADASPLLEGYLSVTKAMVSDDLATAKASAGELGSDRKILSA